MAFYRVTTPTHTFKLPIDTSECSVIQITYKQGKRKMIKQYQNGVLPEGMTLDEDTAMIHLTQEETKAFEEGTVDIQLRALTTGGQAYASQHFKANVMEVNNEEVLP